MHIWFHLTARESRTRLGEHVKEGLKVCDWVGPNGMFSVWRIFLVSA